MNIKPIKTDLDYRNALERLEIIFDAPVDTQEGDEAEILSLLIENYENEHYPIEAPDPIEAIKTRMEEKNLRQKELIGITRIIHAFNFKSILGTRPKVIYAYFSGLVTTNRSKLNQNLTNTQIPKNGFLKFYRKYS
ncbi:helix-turn-helix domain-containing protein [Brumimicrobium salinarum]|uniref:helix-turn-helix domain-containing protein n=1 Tax=Brumimicrobium salinarum TaxID=2058658 RepID=UPI001F0CDA29|nr:transcriptional regulator [Brumimicrobium salinarum]